MIWWPFNLEYFIEKELDVGRNSPMIWWPFNDYYLVYQRVRPVVTHQWSGDLSIDRMDSKRI